MSYQGSPWDILGEQNRQHIVWFYFFFGYICIHRKTIHQRIRSDYLLAGQTTPVFLPGESPGQRSLGSYSPWGAKSWSWLSNWAQHMVGMESVPSLRASGTLQLFRDAHYFRCFLDRDRGLQLGIVPKRAHYTCSSPSGQSWKLERWANLFASF